MSPGSGVHVRQKPRIGVVIPFFQRQPGLLRKALDSILSQSGLSEGEFRVIIAVVDDSSPVAAESEIDGIELPSGVELRVQRQPNAGPGAARNAGLDLVEEDAEYVAFLDSDDSWTPHHLSNALAAMQAGADLYFAGARMFFDAEDERTTLPAWLSERLAPLIPERRIFSCEGEPDVVIVRGFAITPTVVYRVASARSLRFRHEFFRFGEDQFFYLGVLSGGGRMAVSTEVEAYCGRGVNIYSGNAPGSPGRAACLEHEILYRRTALRHLQLSPEARDHVAKKLAEARRELAYEMIRHLTEGRVAFALQRLWRNPGTLWDTMRMAAILGGRKIWRRRDA